MSWIVRPTTTPFCASCSADNIDSSFAPAATVDCRGRTDDIEPVEWTLMTTEPIETEEQILAVVDSYRHRWKIEELFKALQTGCAYEKRQLGSYQTLVELDVLRHVAEKPRPKHPTLREAMLAIARLGGHLKRNGEPGWMVLAGSSSWICLGSVRRRGV